MGRVARSTLEAGGYVTGIIPSFLIRKEHPLTAVQEMVVVEDMHERKQAMFDRADAFVALPGGVGTLDHFADGARAGATGLLAASVFHFGTFTIADVKQNLHAAGLPVRLPRQAA